eukprot:14668161-Alexandrium_andersonii.AAC.1
MPFATVLGPCRAFSNPDRTMTWSLLCVPWIFAMPRNVGALVGNLNETERTESPVAAIETSRKPDNNKNTT